MNTRHLLLIVPIVFLLSLPVLADAAYYRGGTLNSNPTIYTTFTASGAPDGGDINCYASANWGSYQARAVIYKEVSVSSSGQIKVGVTWTLSGKFVVGAVWSGASWAAYYFWSGTTTLWSMTVDGRPLHGSWVDSDTDGGPNPVNRETYASFVYTTYFTLPDNVPSTGTIFVGIWLYFSVQCLLPSYSRIQGIADGTPLHIDVTQIHWMYV